MRVVKEREKDKTHGKSYSIPNRSFHKVTKKYIASKEVK